MSTSRRNQSRMPRVLLAAAVCVLLAIRSGFAYTPGAPVSKKPSRGQLHNKNQLPSNPLEVPDEEPQEDPAAKPPMPEHRVPYTLNIVAQFPQHQTMHEDSRARQFTEAKLTAALEHFEDNIKHVEVHLLVSDNFHRETPGSGVHTELVDDGEEVIKKKGSQPWSQGAGTIHLQSHCVAERWSQSGHEQSGETRTAQFG